MKGVATLTGHIQRFREYTGSCAEHNDSTKNDRHYLFLHGSLLFASIAKAFATGPVVSTREPSVKYWVSIVSIALAYAMRRGED